MVKLLDNTKDQMLHIFPGLKEAWELDDGITFLEVFFLLYCSKMELLHKKNQFKYHNGPEPPFLALDLETLKIRLAPLEMNHRPFFSEEEADFLEELDEESFAHPVYLGKDKYLYTMDLLMNHTIDDQENCRLMNSWITCVYDLKHMEERNETRFNISKRKNSKSRIFNKRKGGWLGLRHFFSSKT